MKTILIYIIAIASLASCSKVEIVETKLPDSAREIHLSAGAPTTTVKPETKAPIVSGSTFTAAIAGWESETAISYATEAKWATTALITASKTPQDITLIDKQVYNANSKIKTYVRGWYPEGVLANGVVSFDNADGQTDAMLVEAEVVGSAIDKENKTLAFQHPTTQLKFAVKGDNTFAAGTTLNSIVVKGVQIPNGFNLTTATPSVTYATATDLPVPELGTPVVIPVKTGAEEVTPAIVGGAVMINPPAGNQITLDIETSASKYTNITATIDTDTNFLSGKSYTITLNFAQSGVSLGATVNDWASGTGSGNVN